jgi:hypothetical protein
MKNFRILLVVLTVLLTANFAFAQTWMQTGAPGENWIGIVSSADGSKLVAGAVGGIFCSTNAGLTWASNNNANTPNIFAPLIASSADGNKLVMASDNSTSVFTSADSGATWVTNQVTAENWWWASVASSADGNKLVAVNYFGAGPGSSIYQSINSGAIWVSISVPHGEWRFAVATSPDGTKLIAAENYGGIYTSTDSGATWISNTVPSANWASVALSADGSKLAAAGSRGIYTSTDSAVTWISNNAPSANWSSIASSSDGNKLVATVNGGGIWTWQSTPAPRMNITPATGNFMVSWTVPSADFGLQQSPDLGSWTDMTNAPVLNLTNLQNEVVLPPPGGSVFYLLKTP